MPAIETYGLGHDHDLDMERWASEQAAYERLESGVRELLAVWGGTGPESPEFREAIIRLIELTAPPGPPVPQKTLAHAQRDLRESGPESQEARAAAAASLIDGYQCEFGGCDEMAQAAVFSQWGVEDDPDAVHFVCRQHLRELAR